MATGDAWSVATQRIVTMIKKGLDPQEGLITEGYGTERVVERHARLFAAAHNVDLAMIYPVLLTAFSGATQGAFLAPVYSEDWSASHVPLVFQFLGIAESGARKSTVIREGKAPLDMALNKGVAERRKLIGQWRQEAMDAAGHAGQAEDKFSAIYQKVYDGGICASTLTDSGTQEGIRNKLIQNGGHRVLITGESDVLQEVSKYQKGAGSLGLFVRTWDQETLAVDRANDAAHLYMPEASLPFLIFVQPNAFQEYTAPGPKGYDEFTDKGVFGRAWLWRMPKPEIPAGFQFKTKAKPKDGESSALMSARLLSYDRMQTLVERSNEYRAAKGVRYAWETTPGAPTALKEPQEVRRELLDLDGEAGIAAFVRVQNMLLDLRRALEEADHEDKGLAYQYHPLVARFTDHTMRLAALLTLADDPGALAVDTAHVVDVATRIMPWLWSGWVAVMGERRAANTEEFIEEQTLKNPKGMDLSKRAAILRALKALTDESGPAGLAGFSKGEVTQKARYRIKGWKKMPGIGSELGKALDELANEGKLVERVKGVGPVNVAGKAADGYRLTALGLAEAGQLDG